MQLTSHLSRYPITRRSRTARRLASAALVLAVAAPLSASAVPTGTAPARLLGWQASPASGAAQRPPASAAAGTGEQVIGLITGDRVTLRGTGDDRQVDVQLAERDGYDVSYDVRDEGGQVYVLPSDVAPLVPDVLDPELFNVTELAESGYDLGHGLPVIVMPKEPAGKARALGALGQAPGVRRSTELSSLGAEAITVATGDPAFWRAATTADPAASRSAAPVRLSGALAGADKIWLDERIEVALDRSVPQIGAPQAWQRGYDGTGVTVAVLDTGIDTGHPDLAGKVVGEHSFVFGDTPDDGYGHGTHVAGIVAGVAPGAKQLNGKVLDDSGNGFSSSIIDGMEWAAEAGAEVVNLSLGSSNPSNGFDLLSRAVDQLTEAHDVLFVVAAGNLGPGSWTISSPGAASSALTVGAVDAADRLTSFSSRGPRLVPELRHLIGGVFAVKPDITAPGSGIVSARANGTTMGTPVDAHHTRASGTSMATPHVAGAAAIVLQRQPGLGAAALKSALVGSASPGDGLTVYQQGGGRVDVPAALDAGVTATPAPLDFGSFTHPYDQAEPVSKTVTYTNTRDEPLSLDLSLDVRSPESGAARGLRVEPATLDLAAGQSADVTVSLDPRAGAEGRFGGYLVATDRAGTVRHRTPTGYWLEPPTYTLTIKGLDRAGKPTSGPLDDVDVVDVHDLNTFTERRTFYRSDGTVTIEVPRGTYGIFGRFQDPSPRFGEELSIVSRPEIAVTGDLTVTLDARTANRVTVQTPHRSAPLPYSEVLVGYHRRSAAGQSFARVYSADPTTPVYVAGAAAPSTGELTTFSRWLLGGTDDRGRPELYDLALVEDGAIPASQHHVIDAGDLAEVRNRYHSDFPDQVVRSTRFVEIPGWEGWELGSSHEFNVPTERTEYYLANSAAHRQRVNLNGSTAPTLFTEPVTYTAGQRLSRTWFARPLAPGLRSTDPTVRAWNTLRVEASPWVDPGGNALEGDVDYRFYADGELVSSGSNPRVLPMRATPAQYRLELTSATARSWWRTAPSASTAWTLRSAPPANGGPQTLPLLRVGYDAAIDLGNVLHGRELGIRVDHQRGAAASPVAGAKLWTSYDRGRSWQQRPGRGTGAGRFSFRLEPRDEATVSVKVEAWDTAGNRVEQTVVDAFRLRDGDLPGSAGPAGTTVSASLSSAGAQANSGSSAPPSISADGRYVAFASIADNLVPGAPGFPGGVFVRDLRTGQTARVSSTRDGGPAEGHGARISADGRFVAFTSADGAVVADDTNDAVDVFVHDRVTGRTERVSVAGDGSQSGRGTSSSAPAISADGRYVAFESSAPDLVPDDTNDTADVFVHDRVTGSTERVSVASDGTQTPRFYSSSSPAISADGRYVAFAGSASTLVAGDTNNAQDIFVRDRTTGTTSRVSVAGDGAEGNRSSSDPAISADGRYVAFAGGASTLVAGDTNNTADAFVHDRTTGRTERVSVGAAGRQSGGYTGGPAISADGRHVGFPSAADNLVDGDTNEAWDLFVHDRSRGVTERVSVSSAAGVDANQTTGFAPAFSADGSRVAFVSSASNLIHGDVNGESDVFVRHRDR